VSRRKRARGIAPQASEIEQAPPPERPKHGAAPAAAICALLIVVIFVAFWGLLSSAFVNYDDNVYVTENTRVQRGITWDNARWAFTTTYFGFYYPVTWLSHMVDCQLYGLDAGKHHLTSVVIHAVNAVLLFLLLLRMTGALWRSALVAGLFAIHPLHVESVAWIAERKDVLSTMFWLLTVLAWLGYVKKGSRGWYALALALFALGLMAKSMLVTLPLVLLLLDYWPLGRIQLGKRGWPRVPGKLLAEKAPLFVMSAASCVVTVVAQKSGGAVAQIEDFPIGQRVANAALSYVSYLKKMFWPEPLVVFYPHSHVSLLVWSVWGSLLLLAGLTVFAIRLAKRAPYLAVGWFWYLGILVPVIGLVQVGDQAKADRYTYVSLVGIFIVIAWGLADLCRASAAARWAATVALSVSLAALLVVTRVQTSYWAGDKELWQHAKAETSNNHMAEDNLGTYYMNQGKTEEAITHYREALRSAPGFAECRMNLGLALGRLNHTSEAIECFQRAVEVDPDRTEGWMNLGLELGKLNRTSEAIECFQRVLKKSPDNTDAQINLGSALDREGRPSEALEHYERALRTKPGSAEILNNMGLVLGRLDRMPEAIEHFEKAIQADPTLANAELNLGVAQDRSNRGAEALEHFQRALRLKPDSAQAWFYMGLALGKQDRLREAMDCFQRALKIDPDLADAHYYLGVALLREKRYAEAREQFVQAERLHPGFGQARDNIDKLDRLLKAKR